MTGWLGLLASAAFLAGLMGGVHCAAMCGGWVAATLFAAAFAFGTYGLFHTLLHVQLPRGAFGF